MICKKVTGESHYLSVGKKGTSVFVNWHLWVCVCVGGKIGRFAALPCPLYRLTLVTTSSMHGPPGCLYNPQLTRVIVTPGTKSRLVSSFSFFFLWRGHTMHFHTHTHTHRKKSMSAANPVAEHGCACFVAPSSSTRFQRYGSPGQQTDFGSGRFGEWKRHSMYEISLQRHTQGICLFDYFCIC